MNGNTDVSTMFDLHPLVTSPAKKKVTNILKFQQFVEGSYGIKFENYWKFHEWSVKNFKDFWESIWKYFKVIHSSTYTEVFRQRKNFIDMEWFPGAKLNYAENLFKFRDSHMAIIATDEFGSVEKVTYRQLYDEVVVYASALKASGVETGDCVTCYMSNRKEAIIAFLATASIGAIWSASLPYFGPKPVIARFSQIKPKILFTIDRVFLEKVETDMWSSIMEIEKDVPSLEKIVIVANHKRQQNGHPPIPKSCSLDDFLKLGSPSAELDFQQLPFDHPLTISYTSGTTGLPKVLVHSAGAFMSTLRDIALHIDCTRDDVLLHISPAGWISWNLFTNALHIGLTICLYDGNPAPYWDVIEKFGITYTFIPASFIENFRREGNIPNEKHSLKKLRIIGASCSPVKPQLYEFVRDHIVNPKNKEIFFNSQYGCTEAMGFLAPGNTSIPVHKGEIQCFALGVDIRCVDEEGNMLIGERGDLVISTPTPTLPLRLYNDNNYTLYESLYLKSYPGHWNVGDECWINPNTHGVVILGRSDETMKSNGERLNSSDIYSVIDGITEIEDSLCLSQKNDRMNERVILFVKMASGFTLTKDVERKVRDTIIYQLTPDYAPNLIIETPEIPYNYSGKKMELLVKKILNKKSAVNKDVLKNPRSADFYENVSKLYPF